jgi:hypothetical protein
MGTEQLVQAFVSGEANKRGISNSEEDIFTLVAILSTGCFSKGALWVVLE